MKVLDGLLLRVEDTADVQQWKTKGQKNDENNGDNTSKGGKFVKKLWCCVSGSITW